MTTTQKEFLGSEKALIEAADKAILKAAEQVLIEAQSVTSTLRGELYFMRWPNGVLGREGRAWNALVPRH